MNEQPLKCLIIDDSEIDARLLKHRLQTVACDCEIIHAKTWQSGRHALAEHTFDCVLLDYRLGNVTGLDVLREMRQHGFDIPVVALTGCGSESVAVELMKAGAQDYLTKDRVTLESLERSIHNAIEKVSLERRITEKQEELEQFAHVASHDLRSPLCKISMFCQFLHEEYTGQLGEDADEYLHIIVNNTRRMERLIESLLMYSESGRSNRKLVPVDLNAVAECAVSNLEVNIREKNAQVHLGRLPVVLGDETALTQLFQNLIGNGIKYCESPTPTVHVQADHEDGFCCLVFTDNGIGIAPEYQEEIFEPFKRLHASTQYEGSGIGLATCQRIVKQHGGSITVQSRPGIGSTFRILLPTKSEVSEHDEEQTEIRKAESDALCVATN